MQDENELISLASSSLFTTLRDGNHEKKREHQNQVKSYCHFVVTLGLGHHHFLLQFPESKKTLFVSNLSVVRTLRELATL